MAGGIGSRFWPISRNACPKQFLDILGVGKTFIQMTYERFAGMIPPENFLVVTNAAYKDLVLEQLPALKEDQVLCEPIGRNTAPCVAYAAYRLRAKDPDALMIVTPADHLILNNDKFSEVISEGVGFASEGDALVTIGIRPTRPDTGYGYIQIEPDPNIGTTACHIRKVRTFTEKPNLEMAKVFVESGEFFWNSGIFIWLVSSVIRSFEEFLPEMAAQFASAGADYNTGREAAAIEHIYSQCRPISIDFGIMEKAANVYVRCSDFGWSDIGTWGSLYQHSPKDDDGNVIQGDVMTYDTTNCIVRMPEGILAVIEGLDDYIVVGNRNVLMICPKANEQNVKRFIDDVHYAKGDKFV